MVGKVDNVHSGLTTAERVNIACDDYFYLGRRVDHRYKENIALCIARIASWAVFSIPMGIAYFVSKHVKESNDVALTKDSPIYRKWAQVIALPGYVDSWRVKHQTAIERQEEMERECPKKLFDVIQACKNIPLDPEIKRVYFAPDIYQSFQKDTAWSKVWEDDFVFTDDKITLKEGGKAVIIEFSDGDNRAPHNYSLEEFVEAVDHGYGTKNLQKFVDGGNYIYYMTQEERKLWMEHRKMLPPSVTNILSKKS